MARHKADQRDQIRQETRELLLQAAGEEFALQGFDRANVNRIARQAGFSIGTVYNYFPNKRQLMLAFIDKVAQAHVTFILERAAQESDPSRRLVAFFEAGFEIIHSNITPARAIFKALNGPDEDFRAHLFQAYQPLFHYLSSQVLQPGMDQGAFRSLNREETAGLLMLIYLGTGSQLSPEGEHWLGPAQVADFVLHALKVKGDQEIS